MSTILIADDEARIRRLVSDFLKRDGHTIVEAADGKEALNILENRRPGLDMAILDVMMPGMDGFEVLRELREQVVDYDKMKEENEWYAKILGLHEQHSDYTFASGKVIAVDPLRPIGNSFFQEYPYLQYFLQRRRTCHVPERTARNAYRELLC